MGKLEQVIRPQRHNGPLTATSSRHQVVCGLGRTLLVEELTQVTVGRVLDHDKQRACNDVTEDTDNQSIKFIDQSIDKKFNN